jgi:hypothetical protein
MVSNSNFTLLLEVLLRSWQEGTKIGHGDVVWMMDDVERWCGKMVRWELGSYVVTWIVLITIAGGRFVQYEQKDTRGS